MRGVFVGGCGGPRSAGGWGPLSYLNERKKKRAWRDRSLPVLAAVSALADARRSLHYLIRYVLVPGYSKTLRPELERRRLAAGGGAADPEPAPPANPEADARRALQPGDRLFIPLASLHFLYDGGALIKSLSEHESANGDESLALSAIFEYFELEN